MSEIEIGSKWLRRNRRGTGTNDTLVVRGIHGESVWIAFEYDQKDGDIFSSDYLLRTFEKVKPFFEVGKTYKLNNGWHTRYHITEVREFDGKQYAIAERTNGMESSLDALVLLTDLANFKEA